MANLSINLTRTFDNLETCDATTTQLNCNVIVKLRLDIPVIGSTSRKVGWGSGSHAFRTRFAGWDAEQPKQYNWSGTRPMNTHSAFPVGWLLLLPFFINPSEFDLNTSSSQPQPCRLQPVRPLLRHRAPSPLQIILLQTFLRDKIC